MSTEATEREGRVPLRIAGWMLGGLGVLTGLSGLGVAVVGGAVLAGLIWAASGALAAIAAAGVFGARVWGWVLGLIVCAMGMLNFPLGTVLWGGTLALLVAGRKAVVRPVELASA